MLLNNTLRLCYHKLETQLVRNTQMVLGLFCEKLSYLHLSFNCGPIHVQQLIPLSRIPCDYVRPSQPDTKDRHSLNAQPYEEEPRMGKEPFYLR